jgi:hypothetical protein
LIRRRREAKKTYEVNLWKRNFPILPSINEPRKQKPFVRGFKTSPEGEVRGFRPMKHPTKGSFGDSPSDISDLLIGSLKQTGRITQPRDWG